MTASAALDSTTPFIVVVEPGRSALAVLVTGLLEIGRDCEGLILLDSAISRRHLLVRPAGESVLVSDVGSLNGTSIDGRVLAEPHRLRPGETVQFGGCTLVLGTRLHCAACMRVEPEWPESLVDRNVDVRSTSIGLLAAAVLDRGPGELLDGDAGTVTIVFSDIEGSTTRAVELGDVRWHEVLSVHNRIMRTMLARYHGQEVHSLGDGFMMSFRSARSAVGFITDAQRALVAYGAANPLEGLRVRAGVHTGEAVMGDHGDLLGRHVVMAARIADHARGGEILVSSLVREILAPRGDIVFGESRATSLKGLQGEHVLHRVVY